MAQTQLQKNLKRVPSLATLNLHFNRIDDAGAIAVAEALQHVTNLTALNLSWNRIGNDGAKAIAENLKRVPSLTTLDLSHNKNRPRWCNRYQKRTRESSRSNYTQFEI